MDNPPAFPKPGYQTASQCVSGTSGMTLRDWFAGQALPAVIAATSAGQHHPGGFADTRPMPERMAEDAYRIADAMLAARQQAPDPQPMMQHVAYFDDGKFEWMSGIAPRNCELFTARKDPR